MNSIFLVINASVNPNNLPALKAYLEAITPVMVKFGATPSGRFRTQEKILGSNCPDLTALMEFPSAENIYEMMASDEFKALAELRAKAFTEINLTTAKQ